MEGETHRRFSCIKCSNCGFCCKKWDIYLSKEDIRKLVRLKYPLKRFLAFNPYPVMRMDGKEKACVFLDKDNRCILHQKHGYRSKPFSCRRYPKSVSSPMKGKHDYFFYHFSGKTITRDVLADMLEELKDKEISGFFPSFLENLRRIESQPWRYVDIFNFDDSRSRNAERLRNSIRKVRLRVWSRKLRKKDIGDLKALGGGMFEAGRFIERMQEMIRKNRLLYTNLPLKILHFFFILRLMDHNPETDDLLEFFVRFNRRYL